MTDTSIGNDEPLVCGAERRGRKRSEDKNHAILEAAGDLFLSRGFDRASMDEVAKTAGVSKQTVYGHFQSKEQLFRAVIADKVASYFPENPIEYVASHDIGRTLTLIARQYLSLVLSEEAVTMFRILVASAASHPRMIRLYFEEGPARLNAEIASCLETAVARGELACPDTTYAARDFAALLRGDLHLRAVLGCADRQALEAEVDRHIERSVAAFLKLNPPSR